MYDKKNEEFMYREEVYEEGIVRESKDGIAVISIQDSGKCEECTAKIYCKPGNSEGRSLTVRDPYGVRPGDKVRVAIAGRKILSASLKLYGMPLLLLIAGIFIGMEVFTVNKELFSTLLATGLVGVYALILWFISGKDKHDSFPEIISVTFNKNL